MPYKRNCRTRETIFAVNASNRAIFSPSVTERVEKTRLANARKFKISVVEGDALTILSCLRDYCTVSDLIGSEHLLKSGNFHPNLALSRDEC